MKLHRLHLSISRLAPLSLVFALCLLAAPQARADDFFSTEQPERRLEPGLRLSVNTSNHTMHYPKADLWNVDSWGNGLNIGAVVGIAIRDYIAIEPGFTVSYRSGKYARSGVMAVGNTLDVQMFVGNVHQLDFVIPVMASVRFNVTPNLRWSVDAGPYIDVLVASDDYNQPILLTPGGIVARYAHRTDVDFGLKLGSGITLRRHWYAGIHYLAGMTDAWKYGFGGRNKTWDFTVGYNF